LGFLARETDQILKLEPKEVIEGEFLRFTISKNFYTDYTDTSTYRRTLSISIPARDSTFTFPTNQPRQDFKLLKSDCRGLCADIKMEELKEGHILGKRLNNLT
jgi:hypothetical protein